MTELGRCSSDSAVRSVAFQVVLMLFFQCGNAVHVDRHIIRAMVDDAANLIGDLGQPWCNDGIQHQEVCCAKSCGSCGGPGCGSRKGGSKHCCTGTIRASLHECTTMTDVGCLVPEAPNVGPDETTPSPTPNVISPTPSTTPTGSSTSAPVAAPTLAPTKAPKDVITPAEVSEGCTVDECNACADCGNRAGDWHNKILDAKNLIQSTGLPCDEVLAKKYNESTALHECMSKHPSCASVLLCSSDELSFCDSFKSSFCRDRSLHGGLAQAALGQRSQGQASIGIGDGLDGSPHGKCSQ